MIPYSRPKLSDLYSLCQSKLLVTLHFTAADTLVYGPYMAVPSTPAPPPPPPPPRDLSRVLVKDGNLFFIMTGI